MPYKKNSDINKSARKNMTPHGQTIFRKTFNSALKSKGDEGSAFAIANAAVNKAGERKKSENEMSFAGLVEEIDPEDHSWEINILDKWPNVDSGKCYTVGVEIMREILRTKDMGQILRLVRSGDLKSGSVDHDRSDYTLYRDREDWSEDDTADFHSYIKNELVSFGGR